VAQIAQSERWPWGYKDVAHMKKDTDLGPLRQREDFRKLVAELDGTGK